MTQPVQPSTWVITLDHAGARLDVFLTEQLGRTRSSLQKAIQAGHVKVNGKAASVHRFLKAGDTVIFHATMDKAVEKKKRPDFGQQPNRATSAPASEELPIIDETADWIVLDKPAGLLVHPDAQHETGTLVDLLLVHDPKIGKVGEDPERPGIVHRLDREVSGLMLVAKTQRAYESLQEQMKRRTMEKTYLLLVHGQPPEESGDIKFRIARSSTQPRMAARPVGQSAGRAAWTHYRVLKRFRGAALVEADILSGRTHQIRAHFHALGCPVIGDPLYQIKKTMRNLQAPRLMLQSIRLAFDDPKDGKRKSYALAPVEAFAEVEKLLGEEETA